jgi:hypothetical protein
MAFNSRLSLSLKTCGESPDEPMRVGCAAHQCAMQPHACQTIYKPRCEDEILLCLGMRRTKDYRPRVTSWFGLRLARPLEEAGFGFSADLVFMPASLAEREALQRRKRPEATKSPKAIVSIKLNAAPALTHQGV